MFSLQMLVAGAWRLDLYRYRWAGLELEIEPRRPLIVKHFENSKARLRASSKVALTNNGQPTTVYLIARATTCIYLCYSHLGSKVQFRISMGRMEKTARDRRPNSHLPPGRKVQ